MTGRLSLDLSGQAALVTGASSGLGRHFALTLARCGAKVAVCARRLEALAELVAEIEAFDGRAIPIGLDVTDAESVRDCVATAETELGPISILVNNAGVADGGPAMEMSEETWDRVLDTNLKGAWLVARETAKHMARLGHGGAIVNIASILGLAGTGQVAAYGASKAGLVNLTQSLAVEWARHGIRVNAIAPGYIETDLNRDFLQGPGQGLVKRIPQRRFGQAEDLEGALLLLVSEDARFMTGALVVVDGGHSAQL